MKPKLKDKIFGGIYEYYRIDNNEVVYRGSAKLTPSRTKDTIFENNPLWKKISTASEKETTKTPRRNISQLWASLQLHRAPSRSYWSSFWGRRAIHTITL